MSIEDVVTALPSLDAASVRTTCPYCGVGCGVLAAPDGTGGLSIAGDPAHPANLGRLCSKGSALGETLGLEARLLHPMLRTRSGTYERASWDKALDVVAEGFSRVRDIHGPDALAFYLSGQLLTEDYYVANKLMKGFLGTANVDTNSRLCMASSVAGHRRAFGSDTVPGSYADLDLADLIVLVGSNAAWCHPVLFQRMLKNRRERGARLVVIDTRATATAEDADLFLRIRPGSDTALFSGLLLHLEAAGAFDSAYIRDHTAGLGEVLQKAREIAPDPSEVSCRTGLADAKFHAFFELFASTPRVVTAWSQGVNQSAQGTDKVNAIINCHLATGRIGRPGMGPFSLTGQPNAMGGREVGGLSNMLAAHMNFAPAEVDRVRRFWRAPAMATREGLKAVAMMEAVAEQRIRALWVMATNPAASLPRADRVRQALGKLDLFVVSEVVRSNDTINSGAHVLLPAAAWGEKDGTVTNSERRISRQRAALPLPGDARPDWTIICDVAKRLGFSDAFAFRNAADIFREHAALSAFENDGARDFDLGGLANLNDTEFDGLLPVQWPVRAGEASGKERFFASGGFFHANRRARFIAPEPPRPAKATDAEFPLVLNTGRIRDQWHTMTRTGLSPRLGQHRPTPFVEVSQEDADRIGLVSGGFAELATNHGRALLPVRIDPGVAQGEVFAPIHWSDENASGSRVGALVQAFTDPFSGQPELKGTPVSISPKTIKSYGFFISRQRVSLPSDWWRCRVSSHAGYGVVFAVPAEAGAASEPKAWFAGAIGEPSLEFEDAVSGIYRAIVLRNDGIESVLLCDAGPDFPDWGAVVEQIRSAESPAVGAVQLLSGGAGGDAAFDPPVCVCHGVGANRIRDAIADGKVSDINSLGAMLRAGTNCGSCLPELRRILRQAHSETADVT